jgi:cold shock CspA family protein
VFEQLREGQPIVFDAGRGDKGLRAENVRVVR